MKAHLTISGLTLVVLTACVTERAVLHPSRTAAGEDPDAPKVAQPIREAMEAIRARMLSGAASADLRATSTAFVHVNDAGEIQVYVILTEFRRAYVTRLEIVGLRLELTLPDVRLVQGWISY